MSIGLNKIIRETLRQSTVIAYRSGIINPTAAWSPVQHRGPGVASELKGEASDVAASGKGVPATSTLSGTAWSAAVFRISWAVESETGVIGEDVVLDWANKTSNFRIPVDEAKPPEESIVETVDVWYTSRCKIFCCAADGLSRATGILGKMSVLQCELKVNFLPRDESRRRFYGLSPFQNLSKRPMAL